MEDEKTTQRDSNGRWLPGKSANPAGRGMTNRQRIAERLIADLAKTWEQHGERVLQQLALTEPGKFASIAYGLLPKDVFISVTPATPGNLDPDDWQKLLALAKVMRECAPDASVEDIELALRSAFAKPVESIG
jgi:hypothetical protein